MIELTNQALTGWPAHSNGFAISIIFVLTTHESYAKQSDSWVSQINMVSRYSSAAVVASGCLRVAPYSCDLRRIGENSAQMNAAHTVTVISKRRPSMAFAPINLIPMEIERSKGRRNV